MSAPTAVVTGMIATFPLGGVFWDYVQYAIGLERLGFDVWYLEDSNMPAFDPAAGDYDAGDGSAGAAYLGICLGSMSSRLGRQWHLRSAAGATFGVDPATIQDVITDADLFLNISGMAALREEYTESRCKVFVDTDPGWNHFMRFPRFDREPEEDDLGYRAHDVFFTYANCIGSASCRLPDLGLQWHPTRPPVVVDLWDGDSGAPRGAPWSTVMTWAPPPLPMTDGTVEYDTKRAEFPKIERLPERVPARMELAVAGHDIPEARWRRLGWSVKPALSISHTPETYMAYIQGSRGELSVAKQIYVATRSGWFSCRSVCYLAAGRPVVVQDTGWTDVLPQGHGLFGFTNVEEAAAAVRAVEADYDSNAAAARAVASEHFAAERVLSQMLDRLDMAA